MNYAEASYFDGFHFQHIAAWKELQRLQRIEHQNRVIYERGAHERRNGSRNLHRV